MVAGISGAVLAALLSEVADSEGDTCGLLFGRLRESGKQKLRDDGNEVEDEENGEGVKTGEDREARITGYCYGAGGAAAMAISDALGAVDEESLKRMAAGRKGGGVRGDPPIGWFVQRRNTPLRPSLRETAVCARLRPAMAAILGEGERERERDMPLLLFLVTASRDRSSLAHSYEYKMFEYDSGEAKGWPSFHPCSVKIINIGPEFRGLYDSFSPTASFPLLPQIMDENSSVGKLVDEKEGEGEGEGEGEAVMKRLSNGFSVDRLRAMMGESSSVQVTEMEALYKSMLERLEVLAKEVSDSDMAVKEQEEINRHFRTRGPQI